MSVFCGNGNAPNGKRFMPEHGLNPNAVNRRVIAVRVKLPRLEPFEIRIFVVMNWRQVLTCYERDRFVLAAARKRGVRLGRPKRVSPHTV